MRHLVVSGESLFSAQIVTVDMVHHADRLALWRVHSLVMRLFSWSVGFIVVLLCVSSIPLHIEISVLSCPVSHLEVRRVLSLRAFVVRILVVHLADGHTLWSVHGCVVRLLTRCEHFIVVFLWIISVSLHLEAATIDSITTVCI